MREWAAQVRADDGRVEALRERLETTTLPEHRPITALAELPDADDLRTAALRRRLRRAGPASAGARLRLVGWSALAAAIILGLLLLRPDEPAPEAVPAPLAVSEDPPALTPDGRVPLALDGASRVDLGGAVTLDWDGRGLLHPDDGGPRQLDWSDGRITVDVVPGSTPGFVVSTVDGSVRVLGTRFTVTRGQDGTTVGVDRGRVRVTCSGLPPEQLGPGDRVLCPRRRASGLLAQASRLADAEPDAAVALLEAALLDDVAPPPIRDEVLYVCARTLADAGRRAEARAFLDELLARDASLRRKDAEALRERLDTP